MANEKDQATREPQTDREKKDEKERQRKVQEGNTTVDLPPGGDIPNPIGPPARDTDDESVTP